MMMDTNNNLYDSQFYIYIYVLLCPHCHIDICSSKQCLGALKTQIPTLIANVYTNTHTHMSHTTCVHMHTYTLPPKLFNNKQKQYEEFSTKIHKYKLSCTE